MPPPTVQHDGFLIPNAGVVQNPRMSEPDQVDFSTLAQPLWGVVEGCEITVAGATASTQGGIAIINGALVPIANSSAVIGTGGDQDRFDLVVASVQGVIKVHHGVADINPVFPDPSDDETVLAAVFCPASVGTLTEYLIDKRRFVSKALLTKIGSSAQLIRNTNGGSDHFLILGDGTTKWETDTSMFRSAPSELTIVDTLKVAHLGSTDISASGDITATGYLNGVNLGHGPTLPATAPVGAVFQRDDGHLYVRRSTAWEELATIPATSPVGTLIQSLQTDVQSMRLLGWLALNGGLVNETEFAALFGLPALTTRPGNQIAGTVGNRTMLLPDATGMVLMCSNSSVGRSAGSNEVTLTVGNLPPHKHNARVNAGGGAAPQASMGPAGSHVHLINGGSHDHTINDPGHAHHGADFFGNPSPWICLMWGGNNKIDALFNDRNHTYSVEAMDWTSPSYTNITRTTTIGSDNHPHGMSEEGGHTHALYVAPIPEHIHTALDDLVGGGVPIAISPLHLNVVSYIRS